jgi:MFS family permease
MIVYYSPTILTDSGFPESTALQVSIALGVAYLLAQLGGLSIIDRVGRRRLTLIMIPGAALSLVALGLPLVTGHSERDDRFARRYRVGAWVNGPTAPSAWTDGPPLQDRRLARQPSGGASDPPQRELLRHDRSSPRHLP